MDSIQKYIKKKHKYYLTKINIGITVFFFKEIDWKIDYFYFFLLLKIHLNFLGSIVLPSDLEVLQNIPSNVYSSSKGGICVSVWIFWCSPVYIEEK